MPIPKRCVAVWVYALCLFAAVCQHALAVDLVREGQPVATVVVEEAASAQVKAAAQLLVDYVERATGARLPVVNALPPEGTVICVGRGAAWQPPEQTGLDEDGFDIAFPDPRMVVVAGPTDWGTEFGVCEFLERYVGVRWLLPGEHGDDVPAVRSLSVPAEPVRQAPAVFSRLFSGLQGEAQDTWARRNRMRGRVSFHHYLLHLFPPETYTASHPEFFPIQDGQRFLPPTNDTHHWQPCFTAPGIVEEAVKNIIAYFETHPDATSYSLGANDSSGYCECESCRARISGEKNFLGRVDYSDLYYDWANRVIEGVLARFPDKWFGCLAYSEVAAPPRHVSVHPRLIPYMTYDRMKWTDPELRGTGQALTQDWHARSPLLGWYDYIYGSPYCLPRVWFHRMADYYRFGYANGVRAMYAEAYPNWGEGPKLYVSLKLQWDPSADVDALLDEWYVRCVGEEGAPYLKQYYAHWEDFWTRRVLDSGWFTKDGQYLAFYSPGYLRDISREDIEQSRHWLETAAAKAVTEPQQYRARLLLQAFEYYEASAYAFDFDAPFEGPPATHEEAVALLTSVEQRFGHAARRRELALELFPGHPVLRHPLTMTQYAALGDDAMGAAGLGALIGFLDVPDSPLRDELARVAAEAPDTHVKEQAAMLLDLAAEHGELLTRNPSFEEGSGAAAEGWSWWLRDGAGRMARSDAAAHSGRCAVVCEGVKRGGPVQALPARPGRYGLICYVFAPEGQRPAGTVELSFTLRDAGRNNVLTPSMKLSPKPGTWQALAVVHRITEPDMDRVAEILPILVVDGFEAGEAVYFDDLRLYRLGD